MTQSLVIVITAMLTLSEAFATKNNLEEKEDQISTEVSFPKKQDRLLYVFSTLRNITMFAV